MKKILIVEDHADIRKLLKMTLEFDDFEIHEASTGDAGLALWKYAARSRQTTPHGSRKSSC